MPLTLPATRGILPVRALLWCLEAGAAPAIVPGDRALRHDIQRLADAGVIRGPISTWPLAWGPIASDIRDVENDYETGYRYRGRVVGHASDNDSRIVSTGLILADDQDTHWYALLRYGALNRGGPPDSRNSLTPTRQDVASLDLTHRRHFTYGEIEVGLGIERTDDELSGKTSNDGRAFLQWRSSH